MFKNKIVLPLLAVVSVFTTSTAFADFYRCQQAQQNLSASQAGYNQAVLILSQVQNICGGAIACILTAQNAYNQASVALQQAQQLVNVECRQGGGWGRPQPPPPPPPHGGWGRPRPPRPFPGHGHGHGPRFDRSFDREGNFEFGDE